MSGAPRFVSPSDSRSLERLTFTDRHIDEGWLQNLLDRHPDILPIEEIGVAWGPLVSLGREIGTASGPIDNLFVSPAGELTVVEAKLWRNPEARREVVGQIINYAACLSRMSYDDVNAAIQRSSGDGASIWERVVQSGQPRPVDEGQFVDTLSRNLEAGRFLLLIVGDGIRSDVADMATLLSSQPGLGFQLDLVELRLYQSGETDEFLVVPRVMMETQQVVRAMIDVSNKSGQVSVDVTQVVEADADESGSASLGSLDELRSVFLENLNAPRVDAVIALVEQWQRRPDSRVTLNKHSVKLSARYGRKSREFSAILTFGSDGRAVANLAPMCEWRPLADHGEALRLVTGLGFDGDPMWPARFVDLTVPEQLAAVTQFLEWGAAHCANYLAASEGGTGT